MCSSSGTRPPAKRVMSSANRRNSSSENVGVAASLTCCGFKPVGPRAEPLGNDRSFLATSSVLMAGAAEL